MTRDRLTPFLKHYLNAPAPLRRAAESRSIAKARAMVRQIDGARASNSRGSPDIEVSTYLAKSADVTVGPAPVLAVAQLDHGFRRSPFVLALAATPGEADGAGRTLDAAAIRRSADRLAPGRRRVDLLMADGSTETVTTPVDGVVLGAAEHIGDTDVPAGAWIVAVDAQHPRVAAAIEAGLRAVTIGPAVAASSAVKDRPQAVDWPTRLGAVAEALAKSGVWPEDLATTAARARPVAPSQDLAPGAVARHEQADALAKRRALERASCDPHDAARAAIAKRELLRLDGLGPPRTRGWADDMAADVARRGGPRGR